MMYPALFVEYCASIETKGRLTSLRKSILYVLWQTKKPLKAYEIVNTLLQNQQNSKPSTVYRVLDYFVALRTVHKIDSIQSYTLCHQPRAQLPQEVLMVCNRCYDVRESYDKSIIESIQNLAEVNFFQLGQDVIELKGVCQNCRP